MKRAKDTFLRLTQSASVFPELDYRDAGTCECIKIKIMAVQR